jgi:hypothetical protein
MSSARRSAGVNLKSSIRAWHAVAWLAHQYGRETSKYADVWCACVGMTKLGVFVPPWLSNIFAAIGLLWRFSASAHSAHNVRNIERNRWLLLCFADIARSEARDGASA